MGRNILAICSMMQCDYLFVYYVPTGSLKLCAELSGKTMDKDGNMSDPKKWKIVSGDGQKLPSPLPAPYEVPISAFMESHLGIPQTSMLVVNSIKVYRTCVFAAYKETKFRSHLATYVGNIDVYAGDSKTFPLKNQLNNIMARKRQFRSFTCNCRNYLN